MNDFQTPFDSQQTDYESEDRVNEDFFGQRPATGNYPPQYAPLSQFKQQEQYYKQLTREKDEKQLAQLATGFTVYGIIHAAIACIPFIHLFIGIGIVTGGIGGEPNGPPQFFGWFFIGMALIFITLGWTLSILNFYCGKFIKEHRRYLFCFVISCINCASMPLGTILGVFSLVLLNRDSVKELFGYEVKLRQ